MTRLPVIVGFGGFNAAGRSSFHQAYQRMVIESLPAQVRQETLVGLACMMKIVKYRNGAYVGVEGESYSAADIEQTFGNRILDGTLVRRIEPQFFDVDAVHWQKSLNMNPDGGRAISFITATKQLPQPLPASWRVTAFEDGQSRVEIEDHCTVKVDSWRDFPVKSAGQLPTGFEPGELYKSRFHPRGLQMTIAAASDAVRSVGIEWQAIVDAIKPDEIGVYAGSGMSQLDEAGYGGMLQARLKGGRVTSKQCPLGFNTMPADFINAYVLGSVGMTGSTTGACASFLYNLRLAVEDIRQGRRRVVVVGNSEAPVTPEVMDGYASMSALATDAKLKSLDSDNKVDNRRASRPFGENCGFTMAESAQYFVLMDDGLALQLGADIYAAAADVFVNADGYKKSISAPGPGNYITLAKAVATARAILGEEAICQRSFVQAHGSSTPQNRVTESRILDTIAVAFGIKSWPVSAVKAYVGHSLAPASADQLSATLGVFKYGLIPGIKTIDKVADDVYTQHLDFSVTDIDRGAGNLDVAFLNSKGFGGNNATAVVLSPQAVAKMLRKRYGKNKYEQYLQRCRRTRESAMAYNRAAMQGDFQTIYKFGQGLIDEMQLCVDDKRIAVPGFANAIDLPNSNPYEDMMT